jgi:hypothetical protein
MPYSYKNLTGTISVKDFRIDLGVPGLSSDRTQAVLPYAGVANPQLTADLTVYEYSMDNGVTWDTMTPSAGTVITTLAFTPAGPAHQFVWEIKTDVGALQYNQYIRVRLKAHSGASDTAFAAITLYFEKITTDTSAAGRSVAFPPDYKGIPSSDLMAKAPKVIN